MACVRRGDTAAFEALYDRHSRELLGFCVYMLGSRQDAEDAVQATFASAYRALRADSRPIALRPWLFTIARNDCLSILRRRRPVVELNGEIAPGADPVDQIELREEVRRVFEGLRDLPESQRAALVLAEVHGLSHSEVGEVLGVRADQVKAFVYQARAKLVSERAARDADCREIREELAAARGAALLRGRLRRHMRSCPDCRVYADGMARQRRQLGALLPLAPPLALKYRVIEEALSIGSSDPVVVAGGATVGATAAGTAAELAGGGVKALVCKVAAGVACLGASAGVGVSVLGTPESGGLAASAASTAAAPLLADAHPAGALTQTDAVQLTSGNPRGSAGRSGRGLRKGSYGQSGGSHAREHSNGTAVPGVGGLPLGARGLGRGGRNSGGSGSLGGAGGSGGSGRGGGSGLSSAGERRATAEQRQTKRSGLQQLGEERARAREERKSAAKSREQVQREREEAVHYREEHKPEGHSKAPPTEEELRLKHEAAERRKAERRKQKEAHKQREAEEAEARAAEGEGASAPTP